MWFEFTDASSTQGLLLHISKEAACFIRKLGWIKKWCSWIPPAAFQPLFYPQNAPKSAFLEKLILRKIINITANKCHILKLQVAQLWQRHHAKLDAFSINVQRYSQNHAQNWIFGTPYMGASEAIYALYLKFLTQKPCSRVSSRECQFYS